MSKKAVGWVLLVVGVLLFLISAMADSIGIGVPGFGWKQLVGLVVGVVLAAFGMVSLRSRKA
jgi:uncharacterized RDD family membrane protein YckC